MDSEWSPVIVWFCLGLFALAEFGNVQMGGEIRRMCVLVGDPVVSRPTAGAPGVADGPALAWRGSPGAQP